jgi:translation initiation factor 3 subunit D
MGLQAPKLPTLSRTSDSWGPPGQIPTELRFNEVPYAPFSKGDKLGKVADWAADAKDNKDQKRQQHGRGFRDPYHAYGASAASFFTNEETDNIASFSVVDSSRAATKARPQNAVLKARGRGGAAGATGAAGAGRQGGFTGAQRPAAGTQRPATGGQRGGFGANRYGRRFGWKDYDKPQRLRDASVNITDDWQLVQSIGFNELQKLSFDNRAGQDIDQYGFVHQYNRALDKPIVNIKLQPLDRVVYNVSSSDDPILQELASQNEGTVFASDSIIALLMTATKSVIPWDIIINKNNGQVFLDKREGGPLDFVSVDENAVEPPMESSDKDNINSPSNLAFEATYINHNFIVNAVTESESTKLDLSHANPFYNPEEQKDSDPLLSRGYIYRKFNLADVLDDESAPLNLIVRTEIDAVQTGGTGAGENQFVTIKALNEYGGSSGVLEWKNKFVNQRGAIVAAEMKNNLCKLSRWTVQSILSGAKLMKIGFVSRVTPKDNTQHVIVGVLGREPTQFSSQINLNLNNGWGIVKSVVNIATALEDGKYVLIKDPNNPAIKLYKVPVDTFSDEK